MYGCVNQKVFCMSTDFRIPGGGERMIAVWYVKVSHGRVDGEQREKGLTPDEAISLVRNGQGIICNWWRTVGTISPQERRSKLTAANLDLHVNNYSSFSKQTPFLSLAAGCVE